MAVALVTGANGFLGKHLCRELVVRGDEVIPLIRNQTGQTITGLPLSSNSTAVEISAALDKMGVDFIYHLAGKSDASDLEALYQANVIYAHRILVGASLTRVKPKVVLIGSAAEYGKPVSPDMTARETDVCSPLSPYGISKLAQTLNGMAASGSGLHVTVARLFNPIGPGAPASTALGSFVRQISAMKDGGGVLRTGSLHSVRDFVDVSEAARVIAELPRLPGTQGQVFNICSGAGLKLEDIVAQLIASSGLNVEHQLQGHLRGTSDLDVVIGSNEKLAALGLNVAMPDIKGILSAMLSHEREG